MGKRCSHEILATKCVHFVLWAHESLETPETTFNYRPTWSPFRNYASRNWEKHLRNVEYESGLTHLIVSVLEADPELRKDFLLHLPPNDRYSPSLSPLNIVAYLGLYWPCKELIEKGADVNKIEGA
jgi:hypothetical protein